MANRGSFGLATPPRLACEGKSFYYRDERPEVSITPSYVRSLYLTDRDRAVLRFLSEVGYATTDQLRRLFWPHDTGTSHIASKRLLSLWKKWVLDRQPFQRAGDYGLSPQLVYMLGRAGVRILQDLDETVTQREGMLLVPHNVLLGEAIVKLAEAARDLGEGYNVNFYGEAAAREVFKWDGNWVKMRPDGLVDLEVEGKELPFYVEFDRDTHPISHVVAKVKQYSLYRKSNSWKQKRKVFPNILLVVWSKYELGDGLSKEEAAERRRAKAQRRLDDLIECLQDTIRYTKLRWFCQRLDLVGKEPWRVVTADGMKQSPPFFTR